MPEYEYRVCEAGQVTSKVRADYWEAWESMTTTRDAYSHFGMFDREQAIKLQRRARGEKWEDMDV